MADWHKIETQEDIDLLMTDYGNFHDACIASLTFQSGAFVDDNRTMYVGRADERILSVIFQCQWEPKTIELQFSGLRQIHLIGWQDNYSSDWFDVAKIDNSIHEPADTYIVANALRWRVVDE